MKLGYVMAAGLSAATVAKANNICNRGNSNTDCSAPAMRKMCDTWVKTQADAIESCKKVPLDATDCMMKVMKTEGIRSDVADCVEENSDLQQDAKLNQCAEKVNMLQDVLDQTIFNHFEAADTKKSRNS